MQFLWFILVAAALLAMCGAFVGYDLRRYPPCPQCGHNARTRRIDRARIACTVHGEFSPTPRPA